MSANDRSRHLEQFVAESEPPPQAQHLPPMPSASQRFAAMQEQQLAAQRRGNVINFIDPYSHGKSVVGAPEFNPFQSLVMRTAQQNDDESESTDDDTSETTDDTISTTADSNPKKPIKVTVPKKVAAVKPTAPPRPLVAKTPSPPAPPTTAAPTAVAAAPVVAVTPAPVAATPATAAPAAAPPTAEDEPRGIMDQSMAFLKKNFWAILTVIVVLVALGVAFIYFARPRANETTVPKVAPQVKTNGPPGTPARWSNVENEIIAPAEEITKLQKEKQEVESANEELQKRVLSIEAEVKNASQEQQAHLRDIEKLQKICDQLQAEKDSLKEDNTHMAEFIMQNNLLPAANKPDETPEEPAATATLPVSADKIITPETVTATTDEKEDQQQQEENTEKIDVEAIEKSAVEETQFETIDETQPTDEKIDETNTNKETDEEKQEEEVIVEEKLPWQK